ncbi:MAG: hypothetical protein LQ352_003635 [Teloschistes flavicans]|nr:MAG: hypothetical protein LQ352_003635 [Teloschistes flavicans]
MSFNCFGHSNGSHSHNHQSARPIKRDTHHHHLLHNPFNRHDKEPAKRPIPRTEDGRLDWQLIDLQNQGREITPEIVAQHRKQRSQAEQKWQECRRAENERRLKEEKEADAKRTPDERAAFRREEERKREKKEEDRRNTSLQASAMVLAVGVAAF